MSRMYQESVYEGYLTKSPPKMNRKWQKRYFVLLPYQKLLYFSKYNGEQKGIIDLDKVQEASFVVILLLLLLLLLLFCYYYYSVVVVIILFLLLLLLLLLLLFCYYYYSVIIIILLLLLLLLLFCYYYYSVVVIVVLFITYGYRCCWTCTSVRHSLT